MQLWHIGGDDVHLRLPLLLRLAEQGFAVAAVGRGCAARFSGTGVDYHDISLARGIAPFADARVLRELSSLIRLHRPTIVHAFDTKTSVLVPLAAGCVPETIVVRTINGMGQLFSDERVSIRALRPLYRLAQRLVAGRADHVIFQNEDDMAWFRDFGLVSVENSRLIRGSGVDTNTFNTTADQGAVDALRVELSLSPHIPTITLVARLVRNKGVVEFLAAAKTLQQRGVFTRFLLVGPRASEGSQAIEREVLDAYADVVTITGARTDIPAVLAISDLFVLPSAYREGVPRALLEAAACGVPLVATDMPGCRDVVTDGVNGRLVPPRDAPSLAETIESMLIDLSMWRSRAQAHRPLITERFGLERVVDEHASLYRRLLDRKDTTVSKRSIRNVPLADTVSPKRRSKESWYRRRGKRLLDLATAVAGLVFLWPPLLVAAAAILIEDGRPVLFRQERCGRYGRYFTLFKFRSMRAPTVAGNTDGFELGAVGRVTRTGAVLRRTKLDELPQLFNVIRGEMSLVGPRPEVRAWIEPYLESWEMALEMTPGITDEASIALRNEEARLHASDEPEALYARELLPEKWRHHALYSQNCSLTTDLSILFRTILAITSSEVLAQEKGLTPRPDTAAVKQE